MVTSDVMKMTTTYTAMIGDLFDIIIVASTGKNDLCSTDPSKFKSWKVLETIASLLLSGCHALTITPVSSFA